MSGTTSTNLLSGGSPRVLEGKVAIVTGASRGIGAAICENLASKGASLVMNYTSDTSASKTEALAARLSAQHAIKAVAVQADVGSETGPAHLVSEALKHMPRLREPNDGGVVIDVIINNAGVANSQAIQDVTVDEFRRLYDVNVRGPLLLLKAALPYLPRDRSGRVVNLSSVSASLGFDHQSVYGGTKAALESMTRSWSRELAHRATVNAVNPGPVATDMWLQTPHAFRDRVKPWNLNTPLAKVREGVDDEGFVKGAESAGGRPAYEAEIAGVVAMLCTPDSGWCTGSVVCANGGMKFSY